MELNALLADVFILASFVAAVAVLGWLAKSKATEAEEWETKADYWQRMFVALKNGQSLEEVEP
jgi:hypothetical protein